MSELFTREGYQTMVGWIDDLKRRLEKLERCHGELQQEVEALRQEGRERVKARLVAQIGTGRLPVPDDSSEL
jgi:hypothetical protein